ncbi:hypothetical protein C8R45DRAFT_1189209 [Mycena sanguinolenta]|nr:hypothetical protein C8R45DRAFT_1189209 [Mycena sanguinolenta]
MSNATELPNPFTPLAFLPPPLATQSSLPDNCVFHVKVNVQTSNIRRPDSNSPGKEYSHWRISPHALSSKVNLLFFELVPELNITTAVSITSCNGLSIGFGVCLVLSQTTTALLFFFRVTAVWYPSKVAYAVFSILWVAVLGGGITLALGDRAAHVGPTMQCIIATPPARTELAFIIPLINDTAIFLAINYRILAHTVVVDSSVARLRVSFGGTGLPALSQALLQSGQYFYLIAVVTHIVLLILLKLPQLSPVYHTMLAIPGLAPINVMAFQVFRRIKFGLITTDGTSNIPTIGASSGFHATANPRSLRFLHTREIGKREEGAGAAGSQEMSKGTTSAYSV